MRLIKDTYIFGNLWSSMLVKRNISGNHIFWRVSSRWSSFINNQFSADILNHRNKKIFLKHDINGIMNIKLHNVNFSFPKAILFYF